MSADGFEHIFENGQNFSNRTMSENIEDDEDVCRSKIVYDRSFYFCIDLIMLNLIIHLVSGPKKPNVELSNCKVVTAAASNYIARENSDFNEVLNYKTAQESN